MSEKMYVLQRDALRPDAMSVVRVSDGMAVPIAHIEATAASLLSSSDLADILRRILNSRYDA
jgi:methylglyoxal synthase